MDEDAEHAAPRLSGEGAELLANVLAKRANDHHHTLAAQRNARRRESDGLRQQPTTETSESTPVATVERSTPEPQSKPQSKPGGGEQRRALWAASAAGCVGLGFVIALFFGTQSDRVADQGPEEIARVDDLNDLDVVVLGETEIVTTERDVVEVETVNNEQTTGEALEIETGAANLSAGDIDVVIYDNTTSTGETYSFALRVLSVSASNEVLTDDFAIRVVGESGVEATTFSRFIHETLPVGSSALASVRVEDADASQQYLVVSYEGVELARVPIEEISP